LAGGDQRRLTGNGSALEVVLHDYALYKSTFTLLYFTLLYQYGCPEGTHRYKSHFLCIAGARRMVPLIFWIRSVVSLLRAIKILWGNTPLGKMLITWFFPRRE